MKDGEAGRTRSISGVEGIYHRSDMKGSRDTRMKSWVQRAHWTGYAEETLGLCSGARTFHLRGWSR